jgi:hypothetical protein
MIQQPPPAIPTAFPQNPVRQQRFIYLQTNRNENTTSNGAMIAIIAVVLLIVTMFIIAFTAPVPPKEQSPTYTTTVITTSESLYWEDGAYVFLGVLFILPVIVIGIAAVSWDDAPRSCVYQPPYMRPYDFTNSYCYSDQRCKSVQRDAFMY